MPKADLSPSNDKAYHRRRLWAWALVLGIPGGLAVLALASPGRLDDLPRLCLFAVIFGRPCPACGTLHALSALLHGDFYLALSFNRNVVVLAPLLVWIWFRELGVLWLPRRFIPSGRQPPEYCSTQGADAPRSE
ncbi:MAG TPA: DUF2752 domain-containing protein [Gemmataceae bacterium]|jgi:hypothetical protein